MIALFQYLTILFCTGKYITYFITHSVCSTDTTFNINFSYCKLNNNYLIVKCGRVLYPLQRFLPIVRIKHSNLHCSFRIMMNVCIYVYMWVWMCGYWVVCVCVGLVCVGGCCMYLWMCVSAWVSAHMRAHVCVCVCVCVWCYYAFHRSLYC